MESWRTDQSTPEFSEPSLSFSQQLLAGAIPSQYTTLESSQFAHSTPNQFSTPPPAKEKRGRPVGSKNKSTTATNKATTATPEPRYATPEPLSATFDTVPATPEPLSPTPESLPPTPSPLPATPEPLPVISVTPEPQASTFTTLPSEIWTMSSKEALLSWWDVIGRDEMAAVKSASMKSLVWKKAAAHMNEEHGVGTTTDKVKMVFHNIKSALEVRKQSSQNPDQSHPLMNSTMRAAQCFPGL